MQVKFAYAASSMTRGGEASIGDAARVAAAPASETAAIATLESIQGWAVEPAPFDQEKKNKVQTASRSDRRARPPRRRSTSLSRVRPPALPPTRIGRAWPSARGYGGTFSASVWPAAQAMLEIGATILAGDVRARKVTSSALDAPLRRVGLQAASAAACRRLDADFAQHGEASARTSASVAAPLAFDAARAAPSAKKCADSSETPKMQTAMSTARASVRRGAIAFGGDGGSQEGAITLHDFKDGACAVLDVVQV